MESKSFLLMRDECRSGLLEFTRKAFQTIPELYQPLILDIGCGTGLTAVELAKLSNGQITGIDIDEKVIKLLIEKCSESGISSIEVKNMSLSSLDFPEQYFDIIWSEGSIQFIGFENGIKYWKQFIKPKGFMAIHDEIMDIEYKLKLFKENGYRILDYFTLSDKIWGELYCIPLQQCVNQFLEQHAIDSDVKQALDELEMYQSTPERFRSVFFIVQKMS